MDAVSSLPTEVAQKIFVLLSAHDLINCLKVCQSWRNLINCNHVWGHFYKLFNIEDHGNNAEEYNNVIRGNEEGDLQKNSSAGSEEDGEQNLLCRRAHDLMEYSASTAYNWRFLQCNNYYINLKYRQWKVVGYEPYFAIMYLTLNELHIHCLKTAEIVCTDIISVNLPKNSMEQPMLMNSKYIIIGAYNITHVFKLIEGHFVLFLTFALKYDPALYHTTDAFDDFVQNNLLTNHNVFERILHDDMLWITDVNGIKHIINLDTGEKGMITSLLLCTKLNPKSNFVINYIDVNVAISDIQGNTISSFSVPHIDKLFYINSTVLVICFPRVVRNEKYTLECREIKTGDLLRTVCVPERTRVTIHSTEEILYLLTTLAAEYTCSAMCIRSGSIIWKYHVRCGPHMFWGSFLATISNRYLVVFPAPSNDESYALFSLKGELIYECPFTTGIIISFSDSVIVAKEEGRLHILAYFQV